MDSTNWRVVFLFAGATLALAFWLFSRPEPPPVHREVVRAVTPPPTDPTPRTAKLADEPRVEYATLMPTGRGVSVVASNGKYVSDAVRVAVPDAFGQLEYLPPSDPRAVRYVEEKEAEHARVITYEGPQGVALGASW